MSDNLKGFTVLLARDIRDDDAQCIADAIRMLKGVADVNPLLSDGADLLARQRVRHEIYDEIITAIDDIFHKKG